MTDNNVFMIGWEYPPYNSGGLGVACQGLTQALAKQRTNIKFSLPYDSIRHFDHMDVITCAHPNWSKNSKVLNKPPFLAYSQESLIRETLHKNVLDVTKLAKLPHSQLEKQVDEYAKVVAQKGSKIKNKFNIIHAHDWMSFPAARELKNKTGKPFVAHVHSTEFDRAGMNVGNRYITEVEYEGMNSADHVIAVSYYTKRLLVRKYNLDPEKISVVHNGITKLNDKPNPGRHHFAQKRPVIVFMGRLTLQKGAVYFLDLATRVLKDIPNALFVVAGAGDMYHELLLKTANSKLSAYVVFSGFVREKQKSKLLDRADVFVMPSLSEPFGLVAMEAAQRHTPVIVSKNSGVSEVLKGARVIDFWDINKMAQAINQLVNDKEHVDQVVEQQLKDMNSFSWSNSAKKIKAIYRKVFFG